MAVKGARRMLYAKISVSQDVNSLSIEERLLFTWLIAHGDDEGRLEGDPLYIRNKVVPYMNWSPKKIEKYLNNIKNRGLIHYWQINNRWVIEFVKWELHQSLRKDRIESSQLPSFAPNSDNQMATTRQPIDNHIPAERNISESNSNEVNKSEYKEEVADKNTYKENADETQAPSHARNWSAARDLHKRIEPTNYKALAVYLKLAQQIDHHLLFQWASEIEQDNTIRNRGAVFMSKVDDYRSRKGLQR